MGTGLKTHTNRAGRAHHTRTARGEAWQGNTALENLVLQKLRESGPFTTYQDAAVFFGIALKDVGKLPGVYIRLINKGLVRETVPDSSPTARTYSTVDVRR